VARLNAVASAALTSRNERPKDVDPDLNSSFRRWGTRHKKIW